MLNIETLKSKLVELENHLVLKFSDEELSTHEMRELKISTLTKIRAIRHIIKRMENGKTKI